MFIKHPAAAQKLPPLRWDASDPVFTAAFYRPYALAVETAFLMIDAARAKLKKHCGSDPVSAVTFRLKSPESIRGKLTKKGLPASALAAGAALHDVAGIRVVLAEISDVYRYAAILRVLPAAECVGVDDYIARPKESGYRSLHLLLCVSVNLDAKACMVPVEIQLRTVAMDAWATLEHRICYKPERTARCALPAALPTEKAAQRQS